MRQRFLLALLFLSLINLALTGCGSSPTPTPLPALQPTVAETSVPSVRTHTPIPAEHISLASFVITLPAPWPVLRPTDRNWTDQIAQIQTENNQFAPYLAALAAMPMLTDTVAIAWSPAADLNLALTAIVLPADGLTLQSYLAAAKTELEQSRLALGSGVTIEHAAIRYDLHETHIPLAILQYTMPAAPSGQDATTMVTGYQAAMLGQTGRDLLVLTFVTRQPQPEVVVTEIETIVARLQDLTLVQ